MSKEAMKQALEALKTERDNYLEYDAEDGSPEYIYEAITALEFEVAKQDQGEPVAWMFEFPDKRLAPKFDSAPHGGNWKPLYTNSPTTPLQQPDAYGYAKRLAVAIWKKHYKSTAPQWEPFDNLIGVLTQIDNMTSGLTTPPAQPAPVQEPVGTLNIWFYKGHGNYDFDYWGSLGEGTYTVHVAKSEAPSHNSTCNETLRAQGKAYPRTCKKCGLGPCVGKPKSDTTLLSPRPCPTCEALARTVMLDQTSHDTTPPVGDIRALKHRIHELEGELMGYKKIVADQDAMLELQTARIVDLQTHIDNFEGEDK
jgi:hypothetical protein